MEAKAVAKYVRVSPRKARVVIDQVRGKDVVRARRNPALLGARYRRDH